MSSVSDALDFAKSRGFVPPGDQDAPVQLKFPHDLGAISELELSSQLTCWTYWKGRAAWDVSVAASKRASIDFAKTNLIEAFCLARIEVGSGSPEKITITKMRANQDPKIMELAVKLLYEEAKLKVLTAAYEDMEGRYMAVSRELTRRELSRKQK